MSGYCCGSGFSGGGSGGAGGDTAVLSWGNDNLTSSATTRYLSPWYDDTVAQVAPVQWRAPRAGTLQNLFVRHNVVGGSAGVITYTVRVNGVATALLVALAANVIDGSNLVASVPVAQGDLIDIQVTKAALGGASPNDIIATCEFG